jgi:gliding motility-associated-like protein
VAGGTCSQAGTYTNTWTVSDECGNAVAAVFTQTITVIDNTKPTASNPSPINVQCIADVPAPDITLVTDEADNCTATPVVTFLSDVNNGGTGSTSSPYIVTRTYRISDDCGNTTDVIQTITASDNTSPVITSCPSDITVSNSAGSCGAAVTWSTPVATDNCGTPASSGTHNSGDIFNVGTTIVTYTFTDNSGNTTTCSFNVTVNDTQAPVISCPANISQTAAIGQTTASITVPDPVTSDNCSVSSITWTMTGATTAVSSASGLNLIGTYAFSQGITNITYTVIDPAGLTSSCNFTVTVLPSALPLSGSLVSHSDISCFNESTGSMTVTGTDGITPYQFSIDGGAYQVSGTFNSLAAGSHTVTIKDASSATFDVSVVLTQPATAVSGTITAQTNNLCPGGNSGSVTIEGSGGTAPYRYKTGSGTYQTSGTFTSLSSGTQTVTVQDANLCSVDIPVTITEPVKIVTNVTNQKNVSCAGGSDGSLTISATGGNGSYEYSLNTGAYQSSGTFPGLSAGAYSISVRDLNGCTETASVTLTEPQALTVTAATTPASCPDTFDGTITLTVSGGTPAYNYFWSDGITTGDRSGSPAGSYSVVVTDANGCAASQSAVIDITGSADCIVVQEIITPNNDGFNDTWKIRNIDLFPNAEVTVFNRWGKLVFRTKNLSANEWDGQSEGKLLPADSYHYILHLNDGSKPRSGVVSILR